MNNKKQKLIKIRIEMIKKMKQNNFKKKIQNKKILMMVKMI